MAMPWMAAPIPATVYTLNVVMITASSLWTRRLGTSWPFPALNQCDHLGLHTSIMPSVSTKIVKKDPKFREAALQAFGLPEAAITEDKQVIMPWANRILPAARFARNIPAEEEDTASVISVASSGAPARQKARESDSDVSQPSEADDQTDTATVVEVPTDEDESEPESEETGLVS